MARILIVEDEADIGELYRLALEAAGHAVVGVYADPGTPLNERGRLPAPDLVILDERLGIHSGSEYLSKYRQAFPPGQCRSGLGQGCAGPGLRRGEAEAGDAPAPGREHLEAAEAAGGRFLG